MHHAARQVPYAANRALAILSKLFNFAERAGLRPRHSNPVKGIERYREERVSAFFRERSSPGSAPQFRIQRLLRVTPRSLWLPSPYYC